MLIHVKKRQRLQANHQKRHGPDSSLQPTEGTKLVDTLISSLQNHEMIFVVEAKHCVVLCYGRLSKWIQISMESTTFLRDISEPHALRDWCSQQLQLWVNPSCWIFQHDAWEKIGENFAFWRANSPAYSEWKEGTNRQQRSLNTLIVQ